MSVLSRPMSGLAGILGGRPVVSVSSSWETNVFYAGTKSAPSIPNRVKSTSNNATQIHSGRR